MPLAVAALLCHPAWQSMANPLLAYRKKRGLSQQQVADKLGISRQLVSMIECGERGFTADMALHIEHRLGIDRMVMRPDYFRRRRVVAT